MAYTPIKTIILSNGRLTESVDLTKPLSFFAKKMAYLVLTKGAVSYVIDIAKTLVFESGLSLTTPVGTAYTSRLTDLFVTKYTADGIPILNHAGTYDKRLKVFNPISYKNYSVQFTSISTPEIVDDVSKKGFLDDLVISTKDDITGLLVAVNGIFHRTSIFNNKLYVLDGFRTMRVSGRKDVTIVDTKELGGHSIVQMTSSNTMLTTYNGIAKVTSPSSLKNKTVFLVVDGYFYHLDSDVLFAIDDTHVGIRTNKLPLVEQLKHNPKTMTRLDRYGQDASQSSRKYNDPYETIFLNTRQVPASQFNTRDFQYSRLTAYHSFLVVVNNPSVFRLSFDILPTGTPRYYFDGASRVLSGMMSYGSGLCPSYLIYKDPFKRKSIFIQGQDYGPDYQNQTVNPVFIPTLIPDPDTEAHVSARFYDYASA